MRINYLNLFFATLLLVTGCNKYEDGPDVSLRTAKQRVCGSWSIESLFIDGADSLTDFQSKPFYCGYYVFGSDDDPYVIYGNDCNAGSISNPNWHGEWDLILNDTFFQFGLMGDINGMPYGPIFNGDIKWKILRLANKEMWLETEYYNGKKYEIHFKQ